MKTRSFGYYKRGNEGPKFQVLVEGKRRTKATRVLDQHEDGGPKGSGGLGELE